MSLAIEKIIAEFASLTPQEKIKFLSRIVVSPPGRWIEQNGKLYFIPVEEELTPEELADIEAGKAEIARGEWVDWDDLRKELNF